MQILVAGHSFYDMQRQGLTLDFKDTTVQTLGIGGATIANPKPIFPDVRQILAPQNFKILVLDVRSNDLDFSKFTKFG